jgi:pimeloyl-ACP methyl ester carboxylesterase
MKPLLRLAACLLALYLLLLCVVFAKQRSLLFFPSHDNSEQLGARAGLQPWIVNGAYVGMRRAPALGGRVWLFTHGNGGQAAGRAYAMRFFRPSDGVYVVEYPGYGDKPGEPGEASINAAAIAAYEALRAQYGSASICVLGESMGTGPASVLGSLADPPRRIVLVVPYDRIVEVAAEKYALIPARLLMRDRWDNPRALAQYPGRVDIWGASRDEVIPVEHARRLARQLPRAHYHEFNSGHGWADVNDVDLSE